MSTSVLDTVVVGAGQAGLGTSYFLQQAGLSHVVLERGRIGESWFSQRWDSFQINTLNAISTLPGFPYEGAEPDGFWRRDELVAYFLRYADRAQLPIQTDCTVISVERPDDAGNFVVTYGATGQAPLKVTSRAVVIASGVQQAPKVPVIRSRIPGDIMQLHTATYRNSAALPPGAVVVVGSGQSGVQIAEDLLNAGRKVYLCTAKVGRIPRRYRGRDNTEWSIESKYWDATLASLQDKTIIRATQPQISGVGRYGHSVSLQSLARQGAVILGRLLDVDKDNLMLSDEAAANVRFADKISLQRKADIDAYITRAGMTLPPLEDDPADEPDPDAKCASPLRQLNLHDAGVSTIIWATGFTADFSWIRVPVLDQDGMPIHEHGVSPVRGLYFIGLPWLYKRKSGFIYGVTEDAQYIGNAISEQLSSRKQQ